MKKIIIISTLIIFTFNCTAPKNKNDNTFLALLLLFLNQQTQTNTCSTGTSGDPFFSNQWHLLNDGSISGSVSGEDAKVTPVWQAGILGKGVTVVVVDDGMDDAHEDLSPNLSSAVSGYNLFASTTSSQHKLTSSAHGTSVAGVIAARDNNGIGGRGAAPCSNLVGRGILEGAFSASQSAEAMTLSAASISVSNNSWGAADNTGELNSSNSVWRASIETGISTGRSGKGTVYLWAAGNGGGSIGGAEIDNSNYDGQANYYGVMAICGVGINGKRARYSEKGANLWVCAHTQGNDNTAYTTAITTTDTTGTRGSNNGSTDDYSNNNYTKKFNGTSSATPLAAGVVSLILSANSNLGWRDVREILAKSARKNDSTDGDWATNAAGYNINHKYGFGTVDANAAVTLAKTWTNISAQQLQEATGSSSTGNSVTVSYSGSITKIEYVDINVTQATFNGLGLTLTSPQGTSSVLVENHQCFDSNENQVNCTNVSPFRYSSARLLGENPNGTWTLTSTGGNVSFSLNIIGRTN